MEAANQPVMVRGDRASATTAVGDRLGHTVTLRRSAGRWLIDGGLAT